MSQNARRSVGRLPPNLLDRKRTGPRPEDFQSVPRSPERTTMPQMANPAYAGYAPTGRDYSTYYATPAPAAKRVRTSVDMGTRGVYEGDGRFTQAYPQTAMYGNQPGYQQPAMTFAGYPAGQSGLPEYNVRQPQSIPSAGPSYGAADDPMLAMRSPTGAGYLNPQRYPAYSGAQIPYGLPSQQMPQMSDSQRGSQASLQPLVTGQSVNQQTTV